MTDSNGEVVWRGYISPFGDSATGEGSLEEAVKFTSKELDPETGLYYFNARWYDPVLGRFTTEDPARDGVNWYVYVLNNPLSFIDPTGLEMKVPEEGLNNDEFSHEENVDMVIDYVSTVSGSEAFIDDDGSIQVGDQIEMGEEWDEARNRMQEIIDSEDVIGVTGNTHSSTGWGFNTLEDSNNPDAKDWAKRNGLDAWISISDNIRGEYKSNNPNYRGPIHSLFDGESKYLYENQTVFGAFAHEALGHAFDFVTGGPYQSEYRSALPGENIYHRAVGELEKDVY